MCLLNFCRNRVMVHVQQNQNGNNKQLIDISNLDEKEEGEMEGEEETQNFEMKERNKLKKRKVLNTTIRDISLHFKVNSTYFT